MASYINDGSRKVINRFDREQLTLKQIKTGAER